MFHIWGLKQFNTRGRISKRYILKYAHGKRALFWMRWFSFAFTICTMILGFDFGSSRAILNAISMLWYMGQHFKTFVNYTEQYLLCGTNKKSHHHSTSKQSWFIPQHPPPPPPPTESLHSNYDWSLTYWINNKVASQNKTMKTNSDVNRIRPVLVMLCLSMRLMWWPLTDHFITLHSRWYTVNSVNWVWRYLYTFPHT